MEDGESYVEMGMNMGGWNFFPRVFKLHQGLHGIGLALHSDDYSF